MVGVNDIGSNTVEALVIPPGYDLPELTTIRDVDWVEHRDPISISTTFYDTSDRRLARRGLTLSQEYVDGCDKWTIASLPLHRRLLLAAGRTDDLPTFSSGLAGILGGRELVARLALTTLRETCVAFDADGQEVATISIDRVAARLGVGHDRRTWDTLAVDFLGCDNDRVAEQMRRRLIERGALPSHDTERPAQLLGVEMPERPRKLAGLVHDYLLPQLDLLILNDVALRIGVDAAQETRQSARRVLSVVRVMADIFPSEEARILTAELGWFAGVLGAVTDCDSRRKRLRNAMTSASVAAGHLAGRNVVAQELVMDRDHATSNLHDAMASERYLALFETLAAWRSATPYTSMATRSKKRSVNRYLERAEVELEWRLTAAHDRANEQTMHAARQAARRTRFIAELARPALGKKAVLARSHAIEIQERLGEHRDAVIAAELSRRLSVALDGDARELLISLSAQLEQDVALARERSLRVLIPI